MLSSCSELERLDYSVSRLCEQMCGLSIAIAFLAAAGIWKLQPRAYLDRDAKADCVKASPRHGAIDLDLTRCTADLL